MAALQPQGLRVDLLAHPELTVVRSARPRFSWIVRADHDGAFQHGYRILVASSHDTLARDEGDVWDSGVPDVGGSWRTDSRSTAVEFGGEGLEPDRAYVWKVMTWLGPDDPSPWSEAQGFTTAAELDEIGLAWYPPVVTKVEPAEFVRLDDGRVFVDFGRAAFATVEIACEVSDETELEFHLGEVRDGAYRVARRPGGSRRYRCVRAKADQGRPTLRVEIPPDDRNTGDLAVRLPPEHFDVMPFRYCEIVGAPPTLRSGDVRQIAVHYPFNDGAASFVSSLPVLNDVWRLCHYTMKATSFLGVYVDGDRERIPYEADAYINGLGHFGCDAEYTIARRSIEHLIFSPTWPTEWHLYLVIAAWTEYLWSGDPRLIAGRYEDLVAKALLPLRTADGLLDTREIPPAVLEQIHFTGGQAEHFRHVGVQDIVDWPEVERDGHEMLPVNSVVSALHYRAVRCLARIATELGKTDDATRFETAARETRSGFQRLLVSEATGLVLDGVGSSHSSLHSNAFALACGLVPDERLLPVREFVRSKGMACSVYASQILLEALYEAGEDDHALALLSATGERSWAHMIHDLGTTITAEAWDDRVKPNQDWNHAWGAAPAGILPCYLLGVRPVAPGFAKVVIDPQPGTLEWVEGRVPTVRGAVRVSAWSESGRVRQIEVDVPANVEASIRIRGPRGSLETVVVDGVRTVSVRDLLGVRVDHLGSGRHTIVALW